MNKQFIFEFNAFSCIVTVYDYIFFIVLKQNFFKIKWWQDGTGGVGTYVEGTKEKNVVDGMMYLRQCEENTVGSSRIWLKVNLFWMNFRN